MGLAYNRASLTFQDFRELNIDRNSIKKTGENQGKLVSPVTQLYQKKYYNGYTYKDKTIKNFHFHCYKQGNDWSVKITFIEVEETLPYDGKANGKKK